MDIPSEKKHDSDNSDGHNKSVHMKIDNQTIMIIEKCSLTQSEAVHLFFIDDTDQFICGLPHSIKYLKSNACLTTEFKAKNCKILNIPREHYESYTKLKLAQKQKDGYLAEISCVDKMEIVKKMGNAMATQQTYKLNKAAANVYMDGITQIGVDDAAEHATCNKTNHHNLTLSKLYNNISTLYLRQELYGLSALYANIALFWNKKYVKCMKRIQYIEMKLNEE